MDELETIAKALRIAESGNDYMHQQLVSVDGQRHRKVGAYGIIDARWGDLSEAAGYAGADWRDSSIQDRIVKQKLRKDYEKYGNWGAVIAAFRFGPQAAQAYVESVDHPNKVEVDGYIKNVSRGLPDLERKVVGKLTPPGTEKTSSLSRAESVIRDQLVMMRDTQGKEAPGGSNEELVQGGDQGVPGGAQ